MFAVLLSGIVNGLKMPVDLEVKTKNPVVKVTQHLNSVRKTGPFPILTSPETARELLPSDVVLLECVMGGDN